MNISYAVKLFAQRPLSCAVLAAVLLGMGILFISGWIPDSPNRRYIPGHEWLLAILSWAIALFFAYCWRVGLRRTIDRDKD